MRSNAGEVHSTGLMIRCEARMTDGRCEEDETSRKGPMLSGCSNRKSVKATKIIMKLN